MITRRRAVCTTVLDTSWQRTTKPAVLKHTRYAYEHTLLCLIYLRFVDASLTLTTYRFNARSTHAPPGCTAAPLHTVRYSWFISDYHYRGPCRLQQLATLCPGFYLPDSVTGYKFYRWTQLADAVPPRRYGCLILRP